MFVTFKTVDGHVIETDDYKVIERFEVIDDRKNSIGKSKRHWKTYTCFIPLYNWLTIYIVDANVKVKTPKF